ncbi:MAG: hypothetical protein ACREB3_11390, partial [Burkholderiales bacterium]
MHANAKRSLSLLAISAAAGVCAVPIVALACVDGAPKGEAVTIEREVGPSLAGQTPSMNILGGGWFRAAEVVKRGGSSGDTYVTLELDGEPMISVSFANLKNPWMQLGTPYIVVNVRSEADADILTIWYSPELKFRAFAVLRVDVHEDGVDSLR